MEVAEDPSSRVDNTSHANFTEARVTHTSLHWNVDFSRTVLTGHVTHTVRVEQEGAASVVFDARTLKVSKVSVDSKQVAYTLGPAHDALGAALEVPIPEALRRRGRILHVRLDYETMPEGSALQWLTKEMTAGKKHPYLFTQCQAIHARSLLPCQDSPAVKAAYTAKVTVSGGLTAVMSAVPTAKRESFGSCMFEFEQKEPVPSYLIALAVGNLESRKLGGSDRCSVWSEPEMVEAGAHEFAETETFLKTAESLMGPYIWGRYDILLLPPSFPYGGMENPCLTFVTPTLLAGDRSLADVVIHEIMHSWTGNLVTSATWSHFWLNEGFTMYCQRRVVARLRGEAAAELDATLGQKGLDDAVAHYKDSAPEFTALCPVLKDRDPDDAFSRIPYEKGFNLLYYLMTVVGSKAEFDVFLREYIDEFAGQCITSEDFKQFFLAYFGSRPIKGDLSSIDWDEWFKGQGAGPNRNSFDTTLRRDADDLATAWLAGEGPAQPADAYEKMSTPQRICFLQRLILYSDEYAARSPREVIDPDILGAIDAAYGIGKSRNSEIRFCWQVLNIRSAVPSILDDVAAFLSEQGRMKFVRPLFKELASSEFGRATAERVFEEHGSGYHPICRKMVARDLEAARGAVPLRRGSSAIKEPPSPRSGGAGGAGGPAPQLSAGGKSEGGATAGVEAGGSNTLLMIGAAAAVAAIAGAAIIWMKRSR